MPTMTELFGEPIHTYTRTEALRDGVLMSLTDKAPAVCRQHFKPPVACTASVWGTIERQIGRRGQDLNGIVHDILWMARGPLARRVDDRTRAFKVIIGRTTHSMTITCGPADDMTPCMTLMMEGED